MGRGKDRRNLNVMSKRFRIRYRLHPAARLSALRQRTLNKTAINKDEVSIRTADSFNQIRNIKVPSKAKKKDERTRRWTRRSCAGWRSTFLEGWLPRISLYLQNPNPRDKEPSPLLSNPWFSSSSSSTRAPIFVLPDIRSLKESSWAWSSNHVPIICHQNAKPSYEIKSLSAICQFRHSRKTILYIYTIS